MSHQWIKPNYNIEHYVCSRCCKRSDSPTKEPCSEQVDKPVTPWPYTKRQKMNLTMKSDIVLVRSINPPSKSETIVTLASEDDKTLFGEVVQVGPGRRNKKTGKLMPVGVDVGDTVMFGHKTGEDHFMLVDGESLLAMREVDIMAILSQ